MEVTGRIICSECDWKPSASGVIDKHGDQNNDAGSDDVDQIRGTTYCINYSDLLISKNMDIQTDDLNT